MLEKAVQSAIYEKALKNHYIEILYIDFEDTGRCIKLHQDTKLLSGENIFPESDEQMFDDYICEKILIRLVNGLKIVSFFAIFIVTEINSGLR